MTTEHFLRLQKGAFSVRRRDKYLANIYLVYICVIWKHQDITFVRIRMSSGHRLPDIPNSQSFSRQQPVFPNSCLSSPGAQLYSFPCFDQSFLKKPAECSPLPVNLITVANNRLNSAKFMLFRGDGYAQYPKAKIYETYVCTTEAQRPRGFVVIRATLNI